MSPLSDPPLSGGTVVREALPNPGELAMLADTR
jgi:hypothetical protein